MGTDQTVSIKYHIHQTLSKYNTSIRLRDGKSVKISTVDFLSQKNSTKNAYFATYFTLRQNSVNSPELAQFFYNSMSL